MPSAGATTMWERWNSDVGDPAMNSHNHYAFGAVVGFFYRRLAGIAPAEPGFRRIAVRPIWFPEVGKLAATYESCSGRIATEVDGDDRGLSSLRLTVPPNCVADVELPAGFAWREQTESLGDCDGIQSHRVDGDLVRVAVGSGEYHFVR
jgi:alpha-L-rhamnosidase